MTHMSAPRREPRIIPWLAHWHPWLLLISGAILFAPLGDDFIGQLTIYIGAAIWALALTAQVRHAYNYLCVRCAKATPLDGPAVAERRHRALRLTHWLSEGWRGKVTALGTLALFVAPAVINLTFGHTSWARFLAMAAWLYWIFESFLYLRHLPVEPWCPWCHWDDGGDDEETPIIPEPVAPEGVR